MMHPPNTNLIRTHPDTTDTVPPGFDPDLEESDFDLDDPWRWTNSQVAMACGISAVISALVVWVL